MIVARNILGFVVACIVFFVCSFLLGLVMSFLVGIPFIGWILSYPTTPELYSVILALSASILLAVFLANKICLANRSGRKWGVTIFGMFIAIYGVVSIVSLWYQYGYRDAIWGWLGAVVASIFIAKTKSLEEITEE